MIKDIDSGNRDKRGYWRPNKKLNYGPFLVWPFRVLVFLKWLFGYPGFIFPWNILYVTLTLFVWFFLTPSIETMKIYSIDWIGLVFLRNIVLTFLIVGAWHFFLYIRKTQKTVKIEAKKCAVKKYTKNAKIMPNNCKKCKKYNK